MTQDLVDRLNSQVEKQIHGPQREQILKQLEQDPSADSLAQFTYNTIVAIDNQASSRGAPLDIDVLLGVATETFDILIEILEAMGVQFNPDEMRDEALIKLIMLHMKAVENDPEEKAAAQELLMQLTQDGTMGASMDYIGNKASANTEEMINAGNQMTGPQKNPMAAGVEQGLMQPQGVPR